MAHEEVRAAARSLREAALVGSTASDPAAVDALIDRARRLAGLGIKTMGPHDVYVGAMGRLQRRARLISVSHRASEEDARAIVAHELGHYHLHDDPLLELASLDFDFGAGRIEGYSPTELKEVEADVFAAEFLCPIDLIRDLSRSDARGPSTIARGLGLPYALVLAQTLEARLGVAGGDSAPRVPPLELDVGQTRVAEWTGSHVIVTGPPRCGRTTVAIGRVAHLLESGVPAGAIAVFADTEAAVGRIRASLAAVPGKQAGPVWTGTLEGFAKDMVRGFSRRVGLTPRFTILDDVAAIAHVEDIIAQRKELPGRERTGARRPPAAALLYRAMAVVKRGGPEAIRAIEGIRPDELREIAQVFDARVQAADSVEAAGLLPLASRLLEQTDVLRRLSARFRHLIVDDYEDTSLAGQRLLAQLASGGVTVFALACPGQAINRFRGARPEGVRTFACEFGGSEIGLPKRSGGVRLDRASMLLLETAGAGGRWRATRHGEVATAGAPGRADDLVVSSCPDVAAEAAAIAAQVELWRRSGIDYADQAILAPRHPHLAKLAARLTTLRIPIRHFGEFAERAEVKDLLAVATLAWDADGSRLQRIAVLPTYEVTTAGMRHVGAFRAARGLGAFGALARIDEVPGLSGPDREKLERMRDDFAGLEVMAPYRRVCTWLLERSGHLASFQAEDEPSRQARTAMRQFLGVAEEHDRQRGGDARSLELRLRRMRSTAQDSQFRRSEIGGAADAVSMMTVHAAKGSIFAGVHLAGLPAPLAGSAAHGDGEAALFATGASRATSRLHLSRCTRFPGHKEGRLRYTSFSTDAH